MPAFCELLLISVPRSGTNFFCECVGALGGAVAYNELFNGRGAFGIKAGTALDSLSEHLGTTVDSPRDPALIRFFRSEPHAALDLLAADARAAGLGLMAYKVFPKQLPMPVLATLMQRPGTQVGFILRSRLDVYISYQKAQQQERWKNADTTDFQPELDAAAFLDWAAGADAWFDTTSRMAAACGARRHVWRYDSQIDVDKADLVAALAAELAAAGAGVTAPPAVGRTRHHRQDQARHPFRKVANGPALREALRAARRLRYARAEPDLAGA
ncbi:MAG: hypothetical protein ACK4TB_05280 [Gemmobacter sp.]